MKHTADELDAGETMILTLEDKSILDESGNLVEDDGSDALVNAAIAEEKKVAKAKRAAAKRSVPLYGEVTPATLKRREVHLIWGFHRVYLRNFRLRVLEFLWLGGRQTRVSGPRVERGSCRRTRAAY